MLAEHADLYINGGRPAGSEPRGPRVISHSDYEVEVYSRRSFLDHRPRLVRLAAEFMSAELGWSPEVSLRTMERGLAVTREDLLDERLIPSVEVFKKNGIEVGVSAQRSIDIPTRQKGPVPFLQHLLRAFKEAVRGLGMGRFAVQQAQIIHADAEFYGHATQNAVTLHTNLKSGIFVPGKYLPLEGGFETDLLLQELMIGYFMRRRVNGLAVDWSTGVSKGDFPEPNKSYLPNPGHTPTMELFERMQKDWGMVFPGTDALHGVGQLK